MDDSVCRAFGLLWNAGDERAAEFVSSALQRAQLPQRRDGRQVFLVPGGDRSQVRRCRGESVSRSAGTGVGGGGGVLMRLTFPNQSCAIPHLPQAARQWWGTQQVM